MKFLVGCVIRSFGDLDCTLFISISLASWCSTFIFWAMSNKLDSVVVIFFSQRRSICLSLIPVTNLSQYSVFQARSDFALSRLRLHFHVPVSHGFFRTVSISWTQFVFGSWEILLSKDWFFKSLKVFNDGVTGWHKFFNTLQAASLIVVKRTGSLHTHHLLHC